MPSFIPSEARSPLYPQDALSAPRKKQEITPVPVSGGHSPTSVHPLALPLSHLPHAPAHPCPAPCGRLRSRNVPLTSTPDTCSQASLSCKEGRHSDQLDQGSERSRPHFCRRLGRNRAPRPLKWTRATLPEDGVLCTPNPGRAKSGLSAEYSPRVRVSPQHGGIGVSCKMKQKINLSSKTTAVINNCNDLICLWKAEFPACSASSPAPEIYPTVPTVCALSPPATKW